MMNELDFDWNSVAVGIICFNKLRETAAASVMTKQKLFCFIYALLCSIKAT